MLNRRCRPWTEDDTARTTVLLAEGKSLNEIGRILGRSHHTVRVNMAKVPGYVSRGRGRPKGGIKPLKVAPPALLDGKGWDSVRAGQRLMQSLMVSPC